MPMVTTQWPHWPGSPCENASPVMSAALICSPVSGTISSQVPVAMIVRPVKLTTMIVSMKVCVIDTRPWRTGCEVCAAAAAIGAEPSPDSFENIPRAKPYWMTMTKTAPVNPPAAAEPVNASRSEEHTSELQSRGHLVCRLLLEKKKQQKT